MSSASATTNRLIITLAMGVHKDSITLAVLPATASTGRRVDRLPNDLVKLKRYLDRVAQGGEVRAC